MSTADKSRRPAASKSVVEPAKPVVEPAKPVSSPNSKQVKPVEKVTVVPEKVNDKLSDKTAVESPTAKSSKTKPVETSLPSSLFTEHLHKFSDPVVTPGKVIAKAPTKKLTKPVKKVSKSKSHIKKPLAKSPIKKSIKKSIKKGGKKGKKTVSRVPNIGPTIFDKTGVGIAPARVKSVLTNVALNPVEYAVNKVLDTAESRPKVPKPTKENPEPKAEVTVPPTPVDQLDKDILAVIRHAEQQHEDQLRREFEREHAKTLGDAYKTARDEAQKVATDDAPFDLQSFNIKFDKNFYAKYDEWKVANDSCSLTATVGDSETPKYNQWSRARALVNKLCTRLSKGTPSIVAAFVDQIVMQYSLNGIKNCVADDRKIILLRHALQQSKDFKQIVPLDKFVRTFTNYSSALEWMKACESQEEEVRRLRDEGKEVKSVEEIKYPNPGYDKCFEVYIGNICRSVKVALAKSEKNTEKREKYLTTSLSASFKSFCAYVVYEAVLKIGTCLKSAVRQSRVKTISDDIVYYVIEQVHNVCGMDYERTLEAMKPHLDTYAKWKLQNKKDRAEKRKNGGSTTDTTSVVVEAGSDENNKKKVAAEKVKEAEEVEEVEEVEEEPEDVEEVDEVEEEPEDVEEVEEELSYENQ